MEEEKANANSELRYLALELTKIAIEEKKPFKVIAGEFMQNVYDLRSLLKSGSRVGVSSRMKGIALRSTRQKKR